MAFSFKDLFKKEEQSDKSTQSLAMEPSGSGSRAGLSFDSGDPEGEINAGGDSLSETTPEMTTDMAVNPFEQNLAQGHPVPPQSNHGPAPSPFGMGAGTVPPQGNPPAQAPFSPFSQMPSPFQQATSAQPPLHGQSNGHSGENGQNGGSHRVQDLENKGFRPLSSLPGGQVPSPGPGLTGSFPPEPSPYNAVGNGQGASASPFDIPAAPGAGAFASPFEMQAAPPSHPQPNPFSATPPQAAQPTQPELAPASPPSPFSMANPPSQEPSSANASASPFGLPSGFTPPPPAPAPVPALSFEAPAPQAQAQPEQVKEAPKAAEELKRVELNLKEVLINVPQDLLGFDALKIPDEVTATFSMKSIKPQLSTGRVVLPLQEVIDGCQEKFHPAFAKADRETLVSLPMESLFHQLPIEEPAAPAPAPANPYSFEAPAPPKAEIPPTANPFEMTAPPTPAPAPPANASPFGAALPPFGTATSWPVLPEAPASPPQSFHDSLAPFGQTPAFSPTKETHDAFLPDSEDTQEASYNPFSFDPAAGANSPMEAPLPDAEKPASALFNPFGMGGAKPAPQPTPAFDPPIEATKTLAPAQNAEQDEQLQLRALFMTGGTLDAKRVVELCEEMPGIKACCLLSENGQIQASTINAQEFSRHSQGMVTGLASLSVGLGVENSRSFTMRTDSGAITFFKAQPIYLGVQHSDADFQPGVREKLTLISRELARMC